MKISTRETVEAPARFVYDILSDLPALERLAVRSGAEVARTGDPTVAGVGAAWRVRFVFRGEEREAALTLTERIPDERIAFTAMGVPMAGDIAIDLAPLGPGRTEVTVAVEARPRTIAMRLVLRTLKLGKTGIDRRFERRVAQIGAEIGDRYKTAMVGRSAVT